MKELSLTTGGFPFSIDALNHMQSAYIEAFEAILSSIGAAASSTFIISGCTLTPDITNTVITVDAGWICYQGKVYKVYPTTVNVINGQSQYWVVTGIVATETYQDNTTNDTYLDKRISMQYASIAPANSILVSSTQNFVLAGDSNVSSLIDKLNSIKASLVALGIVDTSHQAQITSSANDLAIIKGAWLGFSSLGAAVSYSISGSYLDATPNNDTADISISYLVQGKTVFASFSITKTSFNDSISTIKFTFAGLSTNIYNTKYGHASIGQGTDILQRSAVVKTDAGSKNIQVSIIGGPLAVSNTNLQVIGSVIFQIT